jgi:hypothetical protein
VHPVALCIHIPLKYTCDRNWEFIGVNFILFVHNMFHLLRAILRWNTTTSLTYFENVIDTTTDPLFYNCSLIWCKSLIIYFTMSFYFKTSGPRSRVAVALSGDGLTLNVRLNDIVMFLDVFGPFTQPIVGLLLTSQNCVSNLGCYTHMGTPDQESISRDSFPLEC